jgi:predicted alpha-1,2-mannosidase
LLGRHKIDDVSGDYPDYTEGEVVGSHTLRAKFKLRTLPRDENGKVKHHMYNSDAFWLTQWNLNVLWGLAWPEMQDEFSASLVQYADNGKLLPRGPNVGGYSYIMTGCPATPLITLAYQKGVLTKVDTKHAYKTMKRNHMPGGMLDGVKKNRQRGFNAGITLETAFQDWTLAEMAKDLKLKKDEKYFTKRSGDWKELFHKGQKLIFPKNADGTWLHENPLSGRGWIEANAWQGTWQVAHAINELANLMGGNDTLCKKLNYAFEQAASTDFVFGYGGGYVSYANQPGCSNAHVFNHAGKPWLSQYWVRRVNEQAYGAITPDKGYGGHDEDQGQMGGVSALMSMGLFSLKGTSSSEPMYDINSPVFDKITITLDPDYYQGNEFTIITHNNSRENCYIQKIILNGIEITSPKFPHVAFAKGGNLEIWLGNKPNKSIR